METQYQPLPKYVLLDGNRKLYVKIVTEPGTTNIAALYAFSNSEAYRRFISNSPLSLRPYPIVKGLFTRLLEEAGITDQILVVDAGGPEQFEIRAIGVREAIEAMETGLDRVPQASTLRFIPKQSGYEVVPILVATTDSH